MAEFRTHNSAVLGSSPSMPTKRSNTMDQKVAQLEDKEIRYTSETLFLVQVDKGRKHYVTAKTIKGDFDQALHDYSLIDTEDGTKKRLVMKASDSQEAHPEVLARVL